MQRYDENRETQHYARNRDEDYGYGGRSGYQGGGGRFEQEGREQEYERGGRSGYGYGMHDQFGQSHYTPQQSEYRSNERYGRGLNPGYSDEGDYGAQEYSRGRRGYQQQRGGMEYGAQQGAYRNWTPQYQQHNQSNYEPYDQRRSDSYQSASFNPRRDEYGADYGYGQQQRQSRGGYSSGYGSQGYGGGRGSYGGGYSPNDPNRYSNPYPSASDYSPYRGEMGGENFPRGMNEQDFGYEWYGQPAYEHSGSSQGGYRRANYGQMGSYGGGGGWGGGGWSGSGGGSGGGMGTMPYSGKSPKGYKRSDERIKEEVCDALMRASHLDPSDIEVTVANGEVTLKGEVCCRNDKRQVEDIAEGVLGVQDVHTNLRIKKNKEGSSWQKSGSSMSSSSQENDANGASRSSGASSSGGSMSSQSKESKLTGTGSSR